MTKETSVYMTVDDTDLPHCGATVWWELTGSISHDLFMDAYDQSGLDAMDIPPLGSPSPSTAFARAVAELQTTSKLVRPLKGTGRYAFVAESADTDTVSHQQECKMWLLGETKGDGTVHSPKVEPHIPQVVAALDMAFNRHLGTLAHDDVSWWLKFAATNWLEGVRLRKKGGFYFIPRDGLTKWEEMTAVLSKCSNHLFHEMPAVHSDKAVEAILSAVNRDANDAVAKYEDELVESDLGKRALATRVRKCKEMQTKIKFYEKLLGTSLTSMLEKLGVLEAQLAAAHLMSMGEEAA